MSFAAMFVVTTVLTSFIEVYYEYVPVYMKREDLEKSVKFIEGERKLEKTGKIYVKGSYIFINHPYRGVYIVDNSDPSQPTIRGFITAPGSLDIAIKGNIMYLDNSVDLVAFDLTTHAVTERLRNVLPQPLSPRGDYGNNEDGFILVEWKKR